MYNAIAHDVKSKYVWYVDSGASNPMKYHQNLFIEIKEPRNARFVKIGDDTLRPIKHVQNVPSSMKDGKEKHMADMLHVPNITNNLVLVGQMGEQGLQVQFNEHGCSIKDFKNKCMLVVKGQQEWKDVYPQCKHAKSRYAHV